MLRTLKGYWRFHTHWSPGHTGSCTAPWGQRWTLITDTQANILEARGESAQDGYDAPLLTQRASSLTTTRANSWRLSILCLVLTNISIIFWHMLRAFVLDLKAKLSQHKEQNISQLIFLCKAHPLKDSNFGKDISSERSKQMICQQQRAKKEI